MAKRTQAANEAQYRYVKAHIKRIPLDVQKEFYKEIKEEADRRGESVNGFIKKAIRERMAL